jgi:Uncharacterised protein family (UPF0236)
VSALGADGDGLAVLELAIRSAMGQLGASLLEGLLGFDRGHRGPRVDCGAGHQAGFVAYRDKRIATVLGPVNLRRAYYHCEDCAAGVAPRDDELAVTGVSMTPGLRAMAARVAAAVPFAKAAALLGDLAGLKVTPKRVERSAEADGEALQAAIAARAEAITAGRIVPLGPARAAEKLYVAVDGTGVPSVPADTDGRCGKSDGGARTRETKLGVVFTQSAVDDDGYPVRDPASSSYVATMEPVATFASLIHAEAARRGSARAQQVIVLGDGAAWIWNLATTHFPGATHIVDLYHAREHLHDLGALAATSLGEDAQRWLAERLAELDRGDITTLAAAARDLSLTDAKAAEVEKALGYFETNASRMRYAHFREQGLFVGSGAIEAGCRSVVAQRLKLSGMRWTTRGASAILGLRCQEASGRWDEIIWTKVNTQTSAA